LRIKGTQTSLLKEFRAGGGDGLKYLRIFDTFGRKQFGSIGYKHVWQANMGTKPLNNKLRCRDMEDANKYG
jgi:hypothetical protein